MRKQNVWLVTGASKGMGLEVVKLVLANGDKVIATSRNLQELIERVGEASESLLPLKVDIRDETQVASAIAEGIEAFGRIDVVLNNAGYYLVGSIEETSDEEFRKTFDVNMFGMVNVIRNIMPHLRRQHSGHVINISSSMGYVGYANTGSYNASKFAVVGLSEALAQEVRPFGVNVTVVAPGMFRTNFLGDTTLAIATNKIEDYGVDSHVKMLQGFSGSQPGDPKKLAKVLYKISRLPEPPLHLPLGADSYQTIIGQRKQEAIELQQWKHLSLSTDFD